MPAFAYTALSKDGKTTSGKLAAESRAAAITQMNRQGLSPVRLQESNEAVVKKVVDDDDGPIGRISHKSVETFTRELANLLAGGVPLSRAMALLRRESSNPAAKRLWSHLHDDVVGGTSLGDALAKYPKNFSSVYVAMVRAGEAGGFLDVVLTQISDFRNREADLMGKVKAAMIYPIVLTFLAVGVLIFLLTFFIPKFTAVFASFGSDLPKLTQMIIAVSHMLASRWGLLIGGALAFGIISLRQTIRTREGRRRMEQIILGTPVLGQLSAHFALVRFTRMLGTLVGAGVSLVAALRTAREAIGNETLADTVSHAIEQVQRGVSLSTSLSNSPKLFPPSVIEMIAISEETGRMDKELLRIATTYEGDLDRQLRMLVAVGEPLMLFIMAALIGTVVIGMLLPILDLQDVVH